MFNQSGSKILQYSNNLFALFCKLKQKQPSIQSRGHRIAPFEVPFLPVLWSDADCSSCPSRRRTVSLKFPPPLGCWNVASRRSKPWIWRRNNPREMDPDYMLDVVCVLFSQVPGVYPETSTYAYIAKLLTQPSDIGWVWYSQRLFCIWRMTNAHFIHQQLFPFFFFFYSSLSQLFCPTHHYH